MKRSGCGYLAQEVARFRPRLVIFGHTNVGYGVQEQIFDEVERAYEGILRGRGGWDDVMRMASGVLCGHLTRRRWRGKARSTAFIMQQCREVGIAQIEERACGIEDLNYYR